jgi:hypothetical protein
MVTCWAGRLTTKVQTAAMQKDTIQVPEKGTYQWQLFNYWSDQYRQTHADHSAYIALNFAGALDSCRRKLHALVQHHRQQACQSAARANHQRAIARLQNTMTGAAMAYERGFHNGAASV